MSTVMVTKVSLWCVLQARHSTGFGKPNGETDRKEEEEQNQVWCNTPVILAFGRWRQEFKASLTYIVLLAVYISPCCKTPKGGRK